MRQHSMWEAPGGASPGDAPPRGCGAPLDEARAATTTVRHLSDGLDGLPPAELVDVVAALEGLANVAAAVQLDAIHALTLAQRRIDQQDEVPPEVTDRAIASMVGLARRQSPHRGSRDRHLAAVLADELPATREAMVRGEGGRQHAETIARHTVFLSREDRGRVDAELGPQIGELSPRALGKRACHRAYELDPEAHTRHAALEHSQRRVTMAPRPDTMALISTYLPVTAAVAVWGVLDREAKSLRAAGDDRSLDQLRADVLVERVTGLGREQGPAVELQVVVPAGSVFGAAALREVAGDLASPGTLTGGGTLPAPMVRDLVRLSPAVRLRRLLADPGTGTVVERDRRSRLFSRADRDLLVARDQTCRTPWCDAPIREADHVVPWARGGETAPENGQGLCQHCNLAKEHPGWDTTPTATSEGGDVPSSVVTTTPTGHRYDSPTPRTGRGGT